MSALRDTDQPLLNKPMHMLAILAGIAFVLTVPDALADPDEAAAAQTAPPAAPGNGLRVYNAVCIACHSPPGIGGAPAIGDGAAWAPRIAQGMDTLVDHALNGYSGSTGIMPRKGGNFDLSDEDIVAAIEYMVAQVAQ